MLKKAKQDLPEFDQRLPKRKAIPLLGSDAFSSVAYSVEAMLVPLAVISFTAVNWSFYVALAVTAFLFLVTQAYRQVIDQYPDGGAAYTIAKENLGRFPALLTASAMFLGYIMTVAAATTAAAHALSSAFPIFFEHQILLVLLFILSLTMLNLRGYSEHSFWVVFPGYLYLFALSALIGGGIYRLWSGDISYETSYDPGLQLAPTVIFLHAFARGSITLTGLEAVFTRISSFRTPVEKSAKVTLTRISLLLAMIFLGVSLMVREFNVLPFSQETVLSALAREIFAGMPALYLVVQLATFLVLIVAANTAYTRLPVLTSIMARDRFVPRQLATLGDKVVFSNGLIGLSLFSFLAVAAFDADLNALIPLYGIGIFLALGLSQTGMLFKFFREKKPGYVSKGLIHFWVVVLSAIVFLDLAIRDFFSGAWLALLMIPALVLLFLKIRDHYLSVQEELSLEGMQAPPTLQPMKHTVIIPVSGIHRGIVDALRYAVSISEDVRACYVELDPKATEEMKQKWDHWAHEIPFVVLKSKKRSVTAPLIEYINDVAQLTQNELITVVIPEFVTTKWWHRLLHNQTALIIRAALLFKRGRVVTTVRYFLKDSR